MSRLSILAKIRNFSKFRLMGVTGILTNLSNTEGFTQEEKTAINQACFTLRAVLYKETWNQNSRELGLTPLKDKNENTN